VAGNFCATEGPILVMVGNQSKNYFEKEAASEVDSLAVWESISMPSASICEDSFAGLKFQNRAPKYRLFPEPRQVGLSRCGCKSEQARILTSVMLLRPGGFQIGCRPVQGFVRFSAQNNGR
jgi:hypothetical protein